MRFELVSRARSGAVIAAAVFWLMTCGCTSFDIRSTKPWTLSQQKQADPRPRNRDELWREDITALQRELPRRHLNAFVHITPAEFDAAAERLKSAVPILADDELLIGMMQLVSAIGDGHTRIEPSALLPPLPILPLTMYWFSDGLHVTGAAFEYADFVGARLEAIGDCPIDAAAHDIATVFPYENEASLRLNLPRYALMPQVLHALGLSRDRDSATMTFRLVDGTRRSVELCLLPPGTPGAIVTWRELNGVAAPLFAQRAEKRYWYAKLTEKKLLYVKYNHCSQDPAESFLNFAGRVLDEIDHAGIEYVIVDVRNNGGGDSMVAWPLILGLKMRSKINQPGHLYVVIGRGTFSSAQLNANEFRSHTRAILVGEPTGQKPNAYGELKVLRLPNTDICISYSTKYFETDPEDRPSMMPDLPVTTASVDYSAGRDPVLDTIVARVEAAEARSE